MSRNKLIPNEKINPDKAFDIHKRICDRELARRALLIDNVKDLVWMFETQSYKAMLGFNPPPKWTGYLGLVEIYYSRAEVERWRKIWSCLVVDLKVDIEPILDIPVSRLEDIAKCAHSKEDAEKLASQARELSSLEWKNAVAEYQGKPTSWDCDHKFKVQQHCTRCGLNHEVEVPKDDGTISN